MSAAMVLDSWPLLEWIKGRMPAKEKFEALLIRARSGFLELEMSRINYGEIVYTIRKAPDIPDRAWALRTFLAAPIQVHSVDDDLIDAAVDLKSVYAFAYADAFAAALAIRRGLPLVTGDKEFRLLETDGLLRLEWVGA